MTSEGILKHHGSLLLALSAALFPVGSATATTRTVEVSPPAASLDVGRLLSVTATVRDGDTPAAGEEVTWTSLGSGYVVVSDDITNPDGFARAILRGFTDGEQTLIVSLGDQSAFDCDDPGQGCDVVQVEWTGGAVESTCSGGGYAVEVAPGLRFGEVPDDGGECAELEADQVEAETPDLAGLLTAEGLRTTRTSRYPGDILTTSTAARVVVGSASASVIVGGEEYGAEGGGYQITVAGSSARSTCFAGTPTHILDAGRVRIAPVGRPEEPVFDDTPAPGTTYDIPGVAHVVFNVRSIQTSAPNSGSASVTAAEITLLGSAAHVAIGHAESGVTCGNWLSFDTLLAVSAHAHTDHATGPVHLQLGLVGDTSDGGHPPFLTGAVQYTDGQVRPPGTNAPQPFTCYDGTVSTLDSIPPERGGHARVLLAGMITCEGLEAGPITGFEMELEDISPFEAPDYYEMRILGEDSTVLYRLSDETDAGAIAIFQT